VIEIAPPPEGTKKPGYCGRCGHWSEKARVVAEIHGDTGYGGTVLRCPDCDAAARARVAK
jgi:hypothetical protein